MCGHRGSSSFTLAEENIRQATHSHTTSSSMKVFKIVACILTAALVACDTVVGGALRSTLEYEAQFEQWMDAYDVHFDDLLQYAKRLQTFIANDRFINTHNAHRGVSFLLGHNEFSHMTSEEFFANKKGLQMPEGYLESLSHKNASDDQIRRRPVVVEDLPPSIDWVAKGGVTPVKNQGQCGSCWAFSTTGAVEGAAFVASGKLVSVSEQELVDCDHNGDMGCNGGLMDHAFDWIHTNGGICAEEKYEYHAAAEQCRNCEAVVKVSSYTDVTTSDEAALKAAVAKQPVSVAIEADQREFQFYKSGVFDLECGTQLDHGVLVVGYGQDADNGKKFWKVKNSWGGTWGEAGFIRLSREMGRPEGQCGIAVAPSYPTASLVTEEKDKEVSGPEQELDLREQAIAELEAMLLADLEEPCETELLMMEERAEARGGKEAVFEYFEEQN